MNSMKQYIKNNLTPIILGVCIGFLICEGFDLIEDVIVKIALINK